MDHSALRLRNKNPTAGLDLPNLHPSLDFITVLAYDYHGSWEETVNFESPWIDAEVGRAPGTLPATTATKYAFCPGLVGCREFLRAAPLRALCSSSPQGGSLDILDTLDYYITKGGVPPAKLSLSLALSGRSWTLKDPEKDSGIGAPATGPGTAGLCTSERAGGREGGSALRCAVARK